MKCGRKNKINEPKLIMENISTTKKKSKVSNEEKSKSEMGKTNEKNVFTMSCSGGGWRKRKDFVLVWKCSLHSGTRRKN